jgi:hypothetical protein
VVDSKDKGRQGDDGIKMESGCDVGRMEVE